MSKIAPGTWVEIEKVILKPEERAPGVPEDTRQTPYLMRLSGFLEAEAEIGAEAEIRTIIGRRLRGVLKTVNPHYTHSFGDVVPELLTIGTEWES